MYQIWFGGHFGILGKIISFGVSPNLKLHLVTRVKVTLLVWSILACMCLDVKMGKILDTHFNSLEPGGEVRTKRSKKEYVKHY